MAGFGGSVLADTLTRATPLQSPRLLFLSQTLPHPPDGGVKIRTYNILRQLARTFDVTALCFFRREGGAPVTAVGSATAALAAFAGVEAFPIPQEHNRGRLLWDHARSTLSRRAYTVFGYESGDFRRRLGELLRKQRFNLVHADSLDLSGYFPVLGALPLACVHHDVQSHLLRRRAAQQPSRLKAAYIAWQAKLMESEEREWLPMVGLNVAVSEVDRERLLEMSPGARVIVVPNGVDLEYFHPMDGGSPADGVVFVGGATWFPNLDGMQWFADAVLPELRRSGAVPTIRWVGRTSAREASEFQARHGIEPLGYVEDVRPHIRGAACYVVPIRVGGGTRIKILDAWGMGKAIVSTSVGCEGLKAVDGENILIRDEPAAFAAAMRQVLGDPELQRRLGQAGRRTVEQHYSWDAIGERMNAEYAALIDR